MGKHIGAGGGGCMVVCAPLSTNMGQPGILMQFGISWYHHIQPKPCYKYSPYKRDFITLMKSAINYLPRCSYPLLYPWQETLLCQEKVLSF